VVQNYLPGLVLFCLTVTKAVTTEISYIKGENTDKTAEITLNGNTIAKINDGTKDLTPGEDYTVSDGTVTFKASYLESLPESETPYTLTISYNPCGETYVGGGDNEAPAATDILLTVQIVRDRDINGDGRFDIVDLVYAKRAAPGWSGYDVPAEKWFPLDGEKFGGLDAVYLKRALLRLPGYV
jgi:hypothetical protein